MPLAPTRLAFFHADDVGPEGRVPTSRRTGGTLVILTDEIEMNGIAGIFERLVARMVRRQYAANLGRLKATLEARPASEA